MEVPLNLTNPSSSKNSEDDGQQRFKTLGDYKVIKELGEGSFSIVYLAQEKNASNREVALKACLKKQIIRDRRVAYVHREKEVLAILSTPDNQHSAVVTLYATFQDPESLYFVLTYAKYGDLLHVMMKQPNKRFTLEDSRYYSAVLLDTLKHIHKLGILHRDVKPENLLVKADGRLLLSDFGSAKNLNAPQQTNVSEPENGRRVRRASFVGTAQYVPPEMLTGSVCTPASDLWSLGVVLFQFLTGEHAFHDESEYLIFKRVESALFKFPDDFDNVAKDLVEKLLVVDPSKRLNYEEIDGRTAVTDHQFFNGINWETLNEIEPPNIYNL